jgi:hypothetical protein
MHNVGPSRFLALSLPLAVIAVSVATGSSRAGDEAIRCVTETPGLVAVWMFGEEAVG